MSRQERFFYFIFHLESEALNGSEQTQPPVERRLYEPNRNLKEQSPRFSIIATFCAFALYPLAIIAAHDFTGLVIAFIIGGLREILGNRRTTLELRPSNAVRNRGCFWPRGNVHFHRHRARTV
jgi:hypothetical protein